MRHLDEFAANVRSALDPVVVSDGRRRAEQRVADARLADDDSKPFVGVSAHTLINWG